MIILPYVIYLFSTNFFFYIISGYVLPSHTLHFQTNKQMGRGGTRCSGYLVPRFHQNPPGSLHSHITDTIFIYDAHTTSCGGVSTQLVIVWRRLKSTSTLDDGVSLSI